jgi:hypothetical protein
MSRARLGKQMTTENMWLCGLDPFTGLTPLQVKQCQQLLVSIYSMKEALAKRLKHQDEQARLFGQ